jgi:hypothetical protein
MEGYMEGNVWGVVRQLADGGASPRSDDAIDTPRVKGKTPCFAGRLRQRGHASSSPLASATSSQHQARRGRLFATRVATHRSRHPVERPPLPLLPPPPLLNASSTSWWALPLAFLTLVNPLYP